MTQKQIQKPKAPRKPQPDIDKRTPSGRPTTH